MARLPVRPHSLSGPAAGRGGKVYPMIDTMQRTPSRLSGDGLPLPQQLARMDLSRLRAYRENLEFYRGLQWQEPWRRRERRLTFNYAKTVVEKTASYVVSGYSSLVDPLDGSPKELDRARRAERALREAHDANNLDQLDFDNEIDCSVLGRTGGGKGAAAGAEPRPVAAFDDPGAVRQPDSGAGERDGGAGHRGAAGGGVGGAGEGAGLPAGPAAGRWRGPARGVREPGPARPARPDGGAPQRLRGEPAGAVRRGPPDGAGPAAQEGAAQAPDPLGGAAPAQRDGAAHPGAADRRAVRAVPVAAGGGRGAAGGGGHPLATDGGRATGRGGPGRGVGALAGGGVGSLGR